MLLLLLLLGLSSILMLLLLLLLLLANRRSLRMQSLPLRIHPTANLSVMRYLTHHRLWARRVLLALRVNRRTHDEACREGWTVMRG